MTFHRRRMQIRRLNQLDTFSVFIIALFVAAAVVGITRRIIGA